MTLKNRAKYVIAGIVGLMGLAALTLHFVAENGQVRPASMTGGATKSDQRDSVVSNDVANHKK